MALNLTYEHTANLLSKIKQGEQIFYVKDADLRKIVEGFGTATAKDFVEAVVADSTGLPTAGAVHTAIQDAVKDLAGAMHFAGVSSTDPAEGTVTIDAEVYTPNKGDVVLYGVKEFIYDGATWQELGDEGIYLTKNAAAELYVARTLTVAGIDLKDNITVAELQTALGLGNLAYKSSATGTVSTIDSIDDITVAKAGEYTVSGTAVAVPTAFSALDVTPAGNVEITAGTAAAATYEKATSATISAAASSTGNYTPAGSITLPTITVTQAPTTAQVQVMTNAGTGYSITEGGVEKGADTTGKFATTGLKAAYTADDETLAFSVLDDTDKATAVTASGGVTYTAPVLSGALPTFAAQSVVTGLGTASASYDGDASFSGTKVQLSADLGHETANATVTQPTFTAEFTGTVKTVTPAASATANAAPSNAKVTVGTETVSITANSTDKTITVQ